ncbi:Cationic amino acid transporter [Operophtera brumata]|uniref:Cationic amino acid transporter n=1 Tax=Operophtera brumata TaxID=104452 RepID=A0A0L7LFW1_OPEBR|nr:Cationic amino acid transporter [Operophtera brumata]
MTILLRSSKSGFILMLSKYHAQLSLLRNMRVWSQYKFSSVLAFFSLSRAKKPTKITEQGKDYLEGSSAAADDPVHLKRRVGLFSGVALIVGTMIGSGIFVSPSGLLERTGSVGISFIIWMACGLLSLLGALAYAELGTMNTSSGAEYAYFMDAFGGPPAFLFSWVSTLVLKPSQMAIICLSFAKYAVEPFVSECEPPHSLVKLVAVISIGNTRHLQEPNFASSTATLGNIATAFYTGLWAYDGWNNLNYVTEEIKNPSKNLPLSIVIGIPLVTLCYALVNVSYLAVMSVSEMADSEAVAVTFGNRLLGPLAWLMPLAVTISTFGSANGTLFVAGRLCFAASREGHLLDILSYVHVRRFTPAPGLIFHASVSSYLFTHKLLENLNDDSLIAVAMVLYGTIDSLIDFFSFTAWIFYGGAMLALIVPIIIPYIVLFVSTYLVVAPIVDKPQWEYLYAAAFICTGMLVKLLFFYK